MQSFNDRLSIMHEDIFGHFDLNGISIQCVARKSIFKNLYNVLLSKSVA